MKVTRKDVNALNAMITIDIDKADYDDGVQKVMENYRKKANIPGFRKGLVPMGLIKKQYGKAIIADEVNKLLQKSLNDYLTEEKLAILGNPIPQAQEDLNWDADTLSFAFELGLSPEFDIDLKSKKSITHYIIYADDKMIDDQVANIQKQYGKLVSQNEVVKNTEITGTFSNQEANIDNKSSIEHSSLKGKKNPKIFLGAKVGDVVTLNTKGLFEDDHDLVKHLKVEHDAAHGLDIEVQFTIEEINLREPADLDQELFDKLFGKDAVKTVTELRDKLKEDAEKQFASQSDQKLLNDVTESLLENTKFDLPAEFLKKWIQTAGENPLTAEEAAAEYEKSEKGLRYQLIEGKLISEHNLQVAFEELKEYSKGMIKTQMAQFGQLNPEESELENIAARILSNQDEVKRLSDQMMSRKLIDLFKSEAKLKEKKTTYDQFVKEAYKK